MCGFVFFFVGFVVLFFFFDDWDGWFVMVEWLFIEFFVLIELIDRFLVNGWELFVVLGREGVGLGMWGGLLGGRDVGWWGYDEGRCWFWWGDVFVDILKKIW